jgi:hypothetical protein
MQDWILVLPNSIGVIGEQPEIWWQKTRPKEERGRINLPCSNVYIGSILLKKSVRPSDLLIGW